jgi:two-component system, LytTR family, sensor kinase
MNSTLNTRQKWWFSFAAIAMLYLSSIYILNLTGKGQLSWASLPVWVFKLLLNTVFAFGWFLLIEWAMARFKTLLEARHNYRNPIFWYYSLSAIGMMIACIAVVWALQPLKHWFWSFEADSPDMNAYATRMTFGLIICITLCGFIALANRQIWLNMEHIRGRADRMEKESLQSQLNALNNQVNPHFLFNSLSILSSLVRRDPDKSEQFIQQLSKAYHYILDRRDTDTVLLREELSFLEAYAFLLKTRFESKFEVHIQPEVMALATARIAPLTLQLLVENAVKHNRMSEKEPLIIYVALHNGNLQVRNRIRERGEHTVSTGLGLQNIINRYALLSNHAVRIAEQQGDFVVDIPLL